MARKVAVQVNGKTIETIEVPAEAPQDVVESTAKFSVPGRVAQHVRATVFGGDPIRVVNFVTAGISPA